jgi:hypothetical protein
MSNHEAFKSVTQAQFRKFSKGYASAKDNLQLALGAAIYQAIVLDNPNWLNELFELAGFWQGAGTDGKNRVSSDGRIICAYVNEGLGLSSDIVKLDRVNKKWVLVKGRKTALEDTDINTVWDTLATVRFDTWATPKADKDAPYSPTASLTRVQKNGAKAIEAGTLDQESIIAALAQIRAIEKQLNAAKRAEKPTTEPKTVTLP